jgi:hypothetical protein
MLRNKKRNYISALPFLWEILDSNQCPLLVGRSFSSNNYFLEIANIHNNKNALMYYKKYWNIIKGDKWLDNVYKKKYYLN